MDLWRRRLRKKGSSSAPRRPAAADTSSRCVAESVSGTHDFVVAGYSRIRDLSGCDSVQSGTFSVGGYDWFLRFYPKRWSADSSDGYAAASVEIRGNINGLQARARVTMGLVDRHGNMSKTSTTDAHNFLYFGRQVFAYFGRASKLASSRRYLQDDCLTVRCVLTVITPRTEPASTGAAAADPLPDLRASLERMLRDGKGTDVTVDVGGQAFRAHRFLLAARSPVLDAELFGPMNTAEERVRIEEMEPLAFELLLHFIYTDSLPPGEGCSTAVTQHLLVAADRYGVDKLKQLCDVKLRTSLDVETLGTTLALARQHDCPLLAEACLAFMCSSRKTLAAVVATDGFRHLMAIDQPPRKSESLPRGEAVTGPPPCQVSVITDDAFLSSKT